MGSNEEIVIQSTLLAIENNMVDDTVKFANKIYIEAGLFRKDPSFIMDIFILFLERAQMWGRHNIARELVYIFDQLPDNQQGVNYLGHNLESHEIHGARNQYTLNSDSMYFKLFGERKIDDDTLAFAKDAFTDVDKAPEPNIITWPEVIDIFIQGDDSPIATYACKRATQVYGEQTIESYKAFKEVAENGENYSIMGYMEEKIKELSKYAKKPDYVMNFDGGELMTDFQIKGLFPEPTKPEDMDTMVLSLSPEQIAETLTQGVMQGGQTVEDQFNSKEKILKIWNTLSPIEKRAMIAPVLRIAAQQVDSSNQNLKIFRLMGPANPMVGYVPDVPDDQQDLCDLYGCRMLYCNCHDLKDNEDDIEYDSSEIDWFLKPGEDYATCDYCMKKLKSRADAVRRPLPHGGWKGRYCNDGDYSFQCALKDLARIENVGSNARGRDLLQRNLIDIYRIELSNIGLQERLEDK